MDNKIFQVDAFTDKAFSGNPAAVCLLPRPGGEAWMLDVAREMNLSETAFLSARDDGFDLRWFTPAVEVELCGHATLAAAHVLWEEGCLEPAEPARFHTRSGLLTAERRDDWVVMDFPAEPEEPCDPPAGLDSALGAELKYVGRNRFDFLVEVESEEVLRNLKPDFSRLQTLDARGIIVTCRPASGTFDFVSRFFAPAVGIDEDPVTGSAHCCLGPFWGARLGKTELDAFQASSRGGRVRVRLGKGRVALAGRAVTIFRGVLSPREI
ncbi:MAG: PhzF family phenazine biosynthesis protein [Nitrospinales bacterium]